MPDVGVLGLVLPPWVTVPAKVVGGAVKRIPWQAWAVAGLLFAGWYYGHTRYDAGEAAQLAADQVTIDALSAELADLKEAAVRAARRDAQARTDQARDMAAAKTKHDQEKARALAEKDRLIADLRAGNVRLRQHWQGCVAADREGSGAGDGAGGSDEAADLRAKGAGDLVGNADAADDEITYLQSLIRAAPRCFKIE